MKHIDRLLTKDDTSFQHKGLNKTEAKRISSSATHRQAAKQVDSSLSKIQVYKLNYYNNLLTLSINIQ